MNPHTGQSATTQEVLTGIERALKSHQLYEGSGPQYRQHLDTLCRTIRASVAESAFNVSPFGPYLDGEEAPVADSPARLWFDLFEEGVRQIVIRRSVSTRELDEFLRVLGSLDPNREDIVTRLWRRDLPHIHTHIVRRLVGVCRTPEQADQDIRERTEYWRSSVMGLVDSNAAKPSAQEVVEAGDLRVLATSEHSFDWCRVSRAPSEEVKEGWLRPKLAREVDRQMQDFDRFLDVADVLEDDSASLQRAVLESMIRHGNVEVTHRFCRALLDRSDSLPDALIELAKQALSEEVLDLESSATVDVFEEAPRPAPSSKSGSTLEAAQPALAPLAPAPEPEAPEALETIDRLMADIGNSNPRVACEAINGLFELGTPNAIAGALSGYSAPSSSVRNLVLLQALRLVSEQPIDAIRLSVDPVLVQAFAKEEDEFRSKILREFRDHTTDRRAAQVRKWIQNPGFKFRSLDERIAIVWALSTHKGASTTAFLGELLTQVRLFSGDTEMTFQIEVAKVLLAINTHQSRLHVYKVMKGWTVPKRVKKEIQAAIAKSKPTEEGEQ